LRENIKKITESSYFIFSILLFALIIIHLKMNCGFGDEVVLRAEYKDLGIWEVIKNSYNNWGSPGIVTVFIYVFVQTSPILFKVCNIMVIMLAAYSISEITNHKKSKNVNLMIVCFVILYPIVQMTTAGWIVTSVAYMFPLAFGLYSLIAIKRICYNEKVEYITTFIALLIGLGAPQMSCVLAGINIVFCIYFIVKKKLNKYSILQSVVSVVFVIYHLTSPGNANRKIFEISYWFPDFNMITTINKIKLGFTNTLANNISTPNLFFTVFCILLCVGVFVKYKDYFYRFIAIIPLSAVLIFGLFNEVFDDILPKLVGLMNVNDYDFVKVTTFNYLDKKNYIPIILGVIILGCILLSIYLIFENTFMSLLVNIIFLAGFASRMIMIFAPTLYASSTRTFIFMYFSIIVCGIFVFKEILNKMENDKLSKLQAIIGAITILSFIEYLAG